MIRRLSLSQRLALVVVSLLMLCAVAVCAVQLHSSAQYGNAMVQRLSSGLAQQIVAREPLLDAHGEVNRQTLKSLFDRLMTFNPSVELYLLSPDGDLLADAAPPGHIQRQLIDMAPVQAFSPAVRRRCMATIRAVPTDESLQRRPLRVDGQLRGYLYIILQGETFNQLAADAWQKTLWSIVLWTLLLVALFGLLAGAGMVLGHPAGPPAHRPWRRAARQHQRHQNPGGPQAGAPAVTRWRCLRTALLTLPGRLPISGIGWPTAIASAVNLWPISLTICARR
ncbi:hypothetical protein KPZU09_26430 [Klebsiella pneumoniae]|uniref:Osmosensitive K+ channel histidine kinase KdpD n=1 Tax=Klebsiella pneumoniae TaxID=573 RepID=A0A919HU78_KLEPN|nr:hypothetical protein KPZU09_26430 [Klebsiella pneumoniae]